MSASGNQPDNRARKAQRVFSSLDWKERARLVSEAEARQLKYYNRIMPLTQGQALFPEPEITTTEAAQRALLLEAYYGLLEATLKGQELFLAPWTRTKDPAAREREAEQFRRRAEDENVRVQAVQERGDWRPLKAKWQQRIPPDLRVPEPEPETNEPDWLRKFSDRVEELFARRSSTYDYQRTLRLLALVPDQTAPIRAASLDPDPPLL